VVHPDARDVVAIGQEFAGLAADDGGVAAVDPHAGEAAEQQVTHRFGLQHEQRQAVLPKIAPAATAAAVVVIGQERVAEQAAQERLHGHPLQPPIEAGVRGMKGQRRHPGLPVGTRDLQPMLEACGAPVALDQRLDCQAIRDHGEDQHVGA